MVGPSWSHLNLGPFDVLGCFIPIIVVFVYHDITTAVWATAALGSIATYSALFHLTRIMSNWRNHLELLSTVREVVA